MNIGIKRQKNLISYTEEIKVFALIVELVQLQTDLMVEHLDHFEYIHPSNYKNFKISIYPKKYININVR